MKNKLWVTSAGALVLVVVATTGSTDALWHDKATLNPDPITTGNLELLAGGELESYVFTGLSANNLAPGDSTSAPLAIRNGGSTEFTYQLAGVAAATSTAADKLLVDALTLTVTDDAACDGIVPKNVRPLYQGPLTGAAFQGTKSLAPSSSVDLCITVELSADAPINASQGTTAATFTFRGDQVQ